MNRVLLFALLFNFCFSKVIYLGRVQCYFDNEPKKYFIDLEYNIDENKIRIDVIDDLKSLTHYIFIPISNMRKLIDKYFEWNKIALEKKIMIDKIISDKKIIISWQDITTKKRSPELNIGCRFIFFSQKENEHQFIMFFDVIHYGYMNLRTFELRPLYFFEEQMTEFRKIISDENINKETYVK